MKLIAPDYFEKFVCIADRCKHSCCIGWEIDIDEETLADYQSVEGEFGERLREGIEVKDGCACFRLGNDERCPFLNENGLCDIILNLGEDRLSQICTDHPRFCSFWSDRTEIGLGPLPSTTRVAWTLNFLPFSSMVATGQGCRPRTWL